MRSRVTRLLSFSEPVVLPNYRMYRSENFLKRKYLQIFWVSFFWIMNLLQSIIDLVSFDTEDQMQPISITNIISTSLLSLAIIATLIRHKKACSRVRAIVELLLLFTVVVSAGLMTSRIANYGELSHRLIMSLASLFFLQTYSLATTNLAHRVAFLIIHGIYIAVFNRDLLGAGSRNIHEIVFLIIVVMVMLMLCVMAYSTARFDRFAYLQIYDNNQKNIIWKQIVDSLPQGAAIIQKDNTNRIKFNNPAFKEIFGNADGQQRTQFIDEALKNVFHRNNSKDKQGGHLNDRNSGQIFQEESEGSSSFGPLNRQNDTALKSFRSLLSYVNRKSELTVVQANSPTPKSSEFLTFDSKMKNKTIEIRAAKSYLEGQEAIIATFTDVTQREKIAKINDKNQFKDNLLSSFSHELKTPLNSSMLLIQTALLSDSLDAHVKELLTGALINNQRLEMILSDILDLCLLETNKLNLNQDKFSVSDVIKDIKELFLAQAVGKNIKLIVKDHKLTSVATVSSDRKRLTQVLFNLISNAIKFTPAGGYVRFSAQEDILNPGYIKFKVKDNGFGMNQEIQAKLRDHLKEGSFTKKVSSSSSGAGIGLFISNQLAVKLGKPITFYSEEGKGSLFSFALRNHENPSIMMPTNINISHINLEGWKGDTIEKEVSDEVSETQPNLDQKLQALSSFLSAGNKSAFSCNNVKAHSHMQSMPTHRQSLTNCNHPEVIIADDDPFNVMSLKEIVKKFHYESFIGYNGLEIVRYAEQLNALKQSCPGCRGAKIIILDCNMPVMDGYTCVKELKKLMAKGAMPTIPVVACTAYIDQNAEMICRVYGFDDFLPKPVNLKKLKEIFDKYFIPK